MKNLFSFSLVVIVAFVMTSTVFAAEKAPLGIGNISVKLDYINFTDNALDNSDVDKGFYVGLEGYGEIVHNLYLGAEVGYANPDGSVDIAGIHANTEVTFVPVELNLKYAVKAAPNMAIDFGAGVSYNYVKEEASASAFGFTGSSSIDDWLFGGQFFADLNYTIGQFFLGINAKYQLTENFKDFNYHYNNWRVGGQIGIMF
jgi:hypothetical protein